MPGCKPAMFSSLIARGSGLRFNDDPDLKLSSVGWCLSLTGSTVAKFEDFFGSGYM